MEKQRSGDCLVALLVDRGGIHLIVDMHDSLALKAFSCYVRSLQHRRSCLMHRCLCRCDSRPSEVQDKYPALLMQLGRAVLPTRQCHPRLEVPLLAPHRLSRHRHFHRYYYPFAAGHSPLVPGRPPYLRLRCFECSVAQASHHPFVF